MLLPFFEMKFSTSEVKKAWHSKSKLNRSVMKKENPILTALFLAGSLLVPALGIKYTTSRLGSTTGGIPWMQNFINTIQVDPDGFVYTFCEWDESSGGARKGTYKDGNILANHNRNINYKQITDQAGKTWTIHVPSGDIYR
jgi:hypothetical protein